jgi:hypothetical protein
MTKLKLTKKLIKLLKINQYSNSIDSNNWCVNYFYLDKKKIVLFTHEKTLYSFIIFNYSTKMNNDFKKFFIENLITNLKFENFNEIQIDKIIKIDENINYSKADDRRVLGSMNDIKIQCEAIYYDNNFQNNVLLLNKELNENLLSLIKYQRPINMMRKELN